MPGHSRTAPNSFTHSLYRDLVRPDYLVAPENVDAEIERRRIQHGMYAWWFDSDLPLVPRGDCLRSGGHDLLYIGIAPPSRSGASRITPIRRRLIRNHLRGKVRGSTLRQSLAALLAERMGFAFSRDARGKPRMGKDDEARLSGWMAAHAAVTFIHSDDPWGLEEALVRTGPPLPLNLSMSQHPFRKSLSALRSQLGRE